MPNLYFPQLTSGALAQFPIRKTRIARTIKNVLADGSMILYSDMGGKFLMWNLEYSGLSNADIQSLQDFFSACAGPLHSFTFIDPTDNMLSSSSPLSAESWEISSGIQLASGSPDPSGGIGGVTVTNTGQGFQEISQSLAVPANYQYCFSLYALSPEPGTLILTRRGSSTEENTTFMIGPNWSRLVASGQLSDPGTNFSVAVSLSPGQQLALYGIQLEAQVSPSRYKATDGKGGVYSNAHWAMDALTVVAEAPNMFSASLAIESSL